MKPISVMNAQLEEIRKALTEADYAEITYKSEREKLSALTEEFDASPEVIREKETALREKYAPIIVNARITAEKIKGELQESAEAWLSSEHILSTRPVSTPSSSNMFKPADANAESMARLSLISELKTIGADQLHIRANEARREHRYGELYLINQENNTRTDSVGWNPVDLSGLNLPDQVKAKQIFAECNATAMTLDHMAKVTLGGTVSAVEKLALGHAIEEMEALNVSTQ